MCNKYIHCILNLYIKKWYLLWIYNPSHPDLGFQHHQKELEPTEETTSFSTEKGYVQDKSQHFAILEWQRNIQRLMGDRSEGYRTSFEGLLQAKPRSVWASK